MHRRRPNIPNASSIAIESGSVDDDNGDNCNSKNKPSKKRRKRGRKKSDSFSLSKHVYALYALVWLFLFARSYLDGITAAGNETWYPVPLIGFIRSELALVCFLIGSVPFLLVVLGWTHIGILVLMGIGTWLPSLVMPGPIPMPHTAYHCYAFWTALLCCVMNPMRKQPHGGLVLFVVLCILLPNLPEDLKPLFSSVQVEDIPQRVINLEPDILEDVGAAGLEAGPLLDFVWENRNDWVKVSHGRALGYFVFGKNFNHDLAHEPTAGYSTRNGFRTSSYRETWGESDFRLLFPEKRREVSQKFQKRFGTSLTNIYARVLGIDAERIVLGDTGVLAQQENMGFPAVKIVFPSLFWHWFNNPHTDNYLYQMNKIDGKKCDRTKQRTFLIPLTEPPGAGLYYWFQNGTRIDVDYKVGNVYSFEVSVLHAIRPFPYFEYSRGSMTDARVTIQAFGIPCGENWYITH